MSLQKSRKIFDPADHEQPVRKRGKMSSSSSPPPTLAAAAAASSFNGGVEANVSVDSGLSSPPTHTSQVNKMETKEVGHYTQYGL